MELRHLRYFLAVGEAQDAWSIYHYANRPKSEKDNQFVQQATSKLV